jgi:hypothetical protein
MVLSMFLEQSNRLAPSAAKCSAIPFPIPFDAPVMTTFMACDFFKVRESQVA